MNGVIDLSRLTLNLRGAKLVILDLSTPAADASLNVIASMMAGGTLELLDDNDGLLVTLPLSDPAAQDAVDGELTLNEIGPGAVVAEGTATSARIVAADGITEILTCDVGSATSNATIRLDKTYLKPPESVTIVAFSLRMP